MIVAVVIKLSCESDLVASQWLFVYAGTAIGGGLIGRCMSFCACTQGVVIVSAMTLFELTVFLQVSKFVVVIIFIR